MKSLIQAFDDLWHNQVKVSSLSMYFLSIGNHMILSTIEVLHVSHVA